MTIHESMYSTYIYIHITSNLRNFTRLDIVNRFPWLFPTHGFQPTNVGPHLGYLGWTQQWRHFFCCAPDGSWTPRRMNSCSPLQKKEGPIVSTGQKKSSNALFFGGKTCVRFFRGRFLFFSGNILHCYVPCKKIYNVFILTFAVFFRVSMRFSTWNDERVLTFFVFGPCVSENDPQKKKIKNCPSQPPANPQPPKKAHLAHALLAGWTEIKVQLDFTCEVTPRSNRTLNEISHRSLHSLETNSESFRLPLKMIGKMKTYEFTAILGKYTPKTNTSPPKNRGGPLGISFFGGESPHFPVRMGC